ncbi:MAG: ParB N-terminal domain-containing protein [Nitrososphaerota archaeon]|nr:ParB N-terminal domain-containing protein [Nitrososphaerota archaeon]
MALATAGFSLGIRAVSSLRPHEETIPTHVRDLVAEMTGDGVQKDPIIIDRDTGTVLDGMHRMAAFKEMGEENAVCCSVEYSSKAITLGRWARCYTLKEGDSAAAAVAEAGDARRTSLAEAFSALQRRETLLAVLTSDSAYLMGGRGTQDEVGAAMAIFDGRSEKEGWQRRFVPEDDVDVELQAKRRIVVIPRRLTKDDVVSAARTGRLFPCKTSMHLIDPRPVAVRFPLAELRSATTETLRKRLPDGGGRLAPAGTNYDGRRYKERLLFLNTE